LTIDYADGRNTSILSAVIETGTEAVSGVTTHEIAQTGNDVDYLGSVDADGVTHISAVTTAQGILRANVIYVPV
jgi:hypothetical protein